MSNWKDLDDSEKAELVMVSILGFIFLFFVTCAMVAVGSCTANTVYKEWSHDPH